MGRFERLFDDLDVGLEAAIAREEEDAANDLARALRQDGDLQFAITRGGGWKLKLAEGAMAPVTEVGTDCVVASSQQVNLLVPLSRAVLCRDLDVDPPRSSMTSFVECLRRLVRARTRVELVSDGGSFTGNLVGAASDHLRLSSPMGDVLVGARSIRAVKHADD